MYRIALELLKDCNLRCKYCFVEHTSKTMDINLAKQSIDFEINRALKLKQKEIIITFFGGEPLLKFDMIKELTQYAKSIGEKNNLIMKFDLVTNGVLFTKDVSEFFIKNNFTVGISVDGTPEDHDLNRVDTNGNPTYKKIISNLNNIIYYQNCSGKLVQINMTVCKNTYRRFFQNLKFIVDLGFKNINTALESYGYWSVEEWNEEDFKELESQFEKGIEFYVNSAKIGKPFIWSFVEEGIRTQTQKRKHYYCGCGILGNFIDTDGCIYPCTACTKESAKIGHVSQGIYEREIKKFLHYERKLSRECNACSIKEFCSGCDCLMGNLEATGDINKVPFVSCEFSKVKYRLVKKLLKSEKCEQILNIEK